MAKVYTFIDDSWWDGGCGGDCCHPYLMECYNSPDVHPCFGSAHSIEEAMIQAIATHKGLAQDEVDYDKTVGELEAEMRALGVCISIVSEYEEDY